MELQLPTGRRVSGPGAGQGSQGRRLQKAYQSNRYQLGDFPVSEELSKKVLSLPMHTALTEDIQQFIIQHLEKALLL